MDLKDQALNDAHNIFYLQHTLLREILKRVLIHSEPAKKVKKSGVDISTDDQFWINIEAQLTFAISISPQGLTFQEYLAHAKLKELSNSIHEKTHSKELMFKQKFSQIKEKIDATFNIEKAQTAEALPA